MVDVSIIIPVYNVVDYLRKSLATVTGQTHTNLEILLIDDGSTDGSDKLCDELAKNDKRIRVIHKKNGGVGSARNLGLDKAVGKYIFFLDPDDLLHKDLLKDNISLAEKYHAELLVFGYADIDSMDVSPEEVTQITLPGLKGAFSYELMKKHFKEIMLYSLTVWTRLYKRDYIEKYKLRFSDQKIGEDALFNLECFNSYFSCIVFNQKPYYYHLVRKNSAMVQYQPEVFFFEYNVAKKLEQIVTSFQDEGKDTEELVHHFYVRAVNIVLGNMAESSCPLTGKEKLLKLKSMLRNPAIKTAFSKVNLSYFRRKSEWIKVALIKCKLYRLVLYLGEAKKNKQTRKNNISSYMK